MQNQPSQWVRYIWDLSASSWDRLADDAILPGEFALRRGTPVDAETILHVVITAYGSDPIWLPMMPKIAERMRARIAETIASTSSAYLLAEHEGSVVAVSGVAESHPTDQNLLTGVCVLPEYQRRGIGRALLLQSLLWLRKRGLRAAQVYTRAGSLADRKMYPLFGPRRIADVIYPGALRMKHNSYFDGRVQSLGVNTTRGFATVGVITPGRYTFDTSSPEEVHITTGELRVNVGGEWRVCGAGEIYRVPAGVTFEVEAAADVSYICYYG